MANKSGLPEIWRGGVWSPFKEMTRLQRGIDRLFDDFFSPSLMGSSLIEGEMTPMEELISFGPPVDIEETSSHFIVNLDVPGVSRENIRIEVRDQQLVVSGEKRREWKEAGSSRRATERYYGTFQRILTLPFQVDPNKIEATYQDGVLHIEIPKGQAAQGKRIEIKEGKLLSHKKEVKPEKAA